MKKVKTVGKMAIGVIEIITVAFTGSCTGNQTKEFETSGKFSLLWEITGNDVRKPSYLYGTIHLYDSSIFKIPKEVYAAIDLCDDFALEIDLNKLDQSEMLRRIVISDTDSTLDKLLEPEIYSEIRNVPLIKMMGEMVNTMKPFYIQQYILVENPLALQSVEMNLNSYAKQKSKNILGIETISEQFDAIDAIPLSEQAQGIRDIYNYCKRENLGFAEAGKKLFGIIQFAYREQDFEKLVNLENEFKMTSSSFLSDSILIGSRNLNMANRIDDLIKQGKTLFAAVGAMHLPDYKTLHGTVALLKEKGYDMRPVLIDLND
ncbi:MAG: TraB/GumN family protein [Prevotellaceae bacterium]|jgi:uncharacterized protein YbaP (TraB family)|nr:TraB/GumN family protein [Prevotellaceae bacterium]